MEVENGTEHAYRSLARSHDWIDYPGDKRFPRHSSATGGNLAHNFWALFDTGLSSNLVENPENYLGFILDTVVPFRTMEGWILSSQIKNITPSEILSEVITRDYNVISLYAKACAIISWLRLKSPDIDQVLISNLFHPSKLIRESAAYVIDKIDSNCLDKIYTRIEPGIVNEIKTSLEHAKNGSNYLMFYRIQFLRKCYKLLNTPEYVLLELAKYLELNKFDKEKDITIDLNEKTYSLLIIIDGSIEVIAEGYDNIVFNRFSMLYTNAIANAVCGEIMLKIKTKTEFYCLDKESLNILIFDYSDIRKSVLDCIEEL